MNEVIAFLTKTPFSIGGQAITVAEMLFIPTLLVVGFLLTNWLARFAANRLASHGVNPDLIQLVRRIIYIVAAVALAVTILDFINVPLAAFAFVSGAIAIGVGFGAQNIINNFISGWILMWERPIRIDDFLEIADSRGTVEAINTRSTRIRRVDGVHMLIPNSALLENTVVNWTLIDRKIRTTVRVGVAYGSPVKTVSELIYQAIGEQDDILSETAPRVIFEDFGDSALIFDAYFWVDATADRDLRVIRSNIRFRIDELFTENNIVIAFPQRDVHIDGAVVVMGEDTTKERLAAR